MSFYVGSYTIPVSSLLFITILVSPLLFITIPVSTILFITIPAPPLLFSPSLHHCPALWQHCPLDCPELHMHQEELSHGPATH